MDIMTKRFRPEDWLWVGVYQRVDPRAARLVLCGTDISKESTDSYRRVRLWGDAHSGIPERVLGVIAVLNMTMTKGARRSWPTAERFYVDADMFPMEYALVGELMALEDTTCAT
jgi:hypothetical protein